MNTDILQILNHLQDEEAIKLFFSLLQKMIQILDIQDNNERLALNPRIDDKKFSVNINTRRVLMIAKKKELFFSFMLNKEDATAFLPLFNLEKEEQLSDPNIAWFSISPSQLSGEKLEKLQAAWLQMCNIELGKQKASIHKEKHAPELYEMAKNTYLLEKYISISTQPAQILLEKYKNIIRETKLQKDGNDELYKWTSVQKYEGKPDLEAADFEQEIKSLNFQNLVYTAALGTIKLLAKERTEKYRTCLRELFDENRDLQERITNFTTEIKTLYAEIDTKNISHHDERAAATYLTYKYPEKYTFYMSNYYQKYCKYIGKEYKKNTGEKYPHYLELIKELIENHINKDTELLQLVQSFMPENAYSDEQHLILAQDILYQTFKEDENMTLELFSRITEQVRQKLRETNHPLAEHYWEGATSTYRQISIQKESEKENIHLLHYEITTWGGINIAIHPESNAKEDKEINAFIKNKATGEWVVGDWKTRNTKKNVCLFFKQSIDIQINTEQEIVNQLHDMMVKMYDHTYKDLQQLISKHPLFLTKKQNSSIINMQSSQTQKFPLNQILYGPPGTGKTYHTINEALAIIENKTIEDIENEEKTRGRKVLKDRFDDYVQKGQIMFCTFHQSMSYEDFVEGIKPVKPEIEDTFVKYKVQDGIFKEICEAASKTKNAPNFEEIYQKFIEDHLDKSWELQTTKQKKPFDVSVSANGDCYATAKTERQSKVGFLKESIKDFLINNIPHLEPSYFPPICEYIKTNYPFEVKEENPKPHILIIDEINRGNVSQIFGELITSIEDSKRKGASEALKIMLPYSKRTFSVPNNVYLIGTMNTADRSVEALDTALRRRFVFKEMMPKPEILSENCEGVNLQQLLTKINERLTALLSKDHQIGHAYFIDCKNITDLQTVFYQKIIPLLQEYFYGHLDKIKWVIGEDFVKVENQKDGIFMGEYKGRIAPKIIFPKLEKIEEQNAFLDAIKNIYEKNTNL